MLFSLQLMSKPECWQSLLPFPSPFSKHALLASQEQVSAPGEGLQMCLLSSNPGSELHHALEQLRSGFEDCS